MDNVILGVSLGCPYYSKERIKLYLAWAKINCNKFGFLIGDEIYAYTYSVLTAKSLSMSKKVAYKMGDQLVQMISNISYPELSIHIFRWNDLKGRIYNQLFDLISKEYKQNEKFAQLIRDEVWLNLGNRLYGAGVCRDWSCNHKECNTLDLYVLHEISGLITIAEYMNFPVEIYPGKDVTILKNIYRNEFPNIYNKLPKPLKRNFVQLIINKENEE